MRRTPFAPTVTALEDRSTPAGNTFIGIGGTPDGVSTTFFWQPNTGSAKLAATQGTTFQWFGANSNFVVRESVGDINGDGTPDVALVAGAGGGSQVGLVNGAGGTPLVPIFSAIPGFNGGLNLTLADFDADGGNEVVVAADQGGGPRVQIYSVKGGQLVKRDDFFGIGDVNFRGGARVAAGDVNGDGTPDLIVAAGLGGSSRVAIYDGKGLLKGAAEPPKLVGDFFAFEQGLRDGVFVTAGDFNGDGKADLAFGGGPGGGPRVYIADGATIAAGNVAAAQASPVANFFAGGDANSRGGIRLTTANIDGDNRADLILGSGDGQTPLVRTYLGKTIASANGVEPPVTQAFNPFSPRANGAITSTGTTVTPPPLGDTSSGVFVG
jgi:hypothetical protein